MVGRPRRFPLDRACRRPAFTRSWMSARSNSAMAPMIWNISRPEGVPRYYLQQIKVVDERMALAGLRLAAVLNEVLGYVSPQ